MSKFNKVSPNEEGYNEANFLAKIHGVGDPVGRFSNNALRFPTAADAQAYAEDLASRWFGMDAWRVETLDGEIVIELEN